MNAGESAISDVDWDSVKVLRGTSREFAATLTRFLQSQTSSEAEEVWTDIENVVFSQGTIYGAAEPTVTVLLASLIDERPPIIRGWIVELLFFLLKGGSREDPTLEDRCQAQARKGVWLLAREARITEGAAREGVMDLIRLIEPEIAERLDRWLG